MVVKTLSGEVFKIRRGSLVTFRKMDYRDHNRWHISFQVAGRKRETKTIPLRHVDFVK